MPLSRLAHRNFHVCLHAFSHPKGGNGTTRNSWKLCAEDGSSDVSPELES